MCVGGGGGEREEESRCLICSGRRLLWCVCVCVREREKRSPGV